MATAPNNWDRLKDIVADALDALPADRARIVRDACGDDTVLLAEATELIASYDETDGVLDQRTDAWLGLGGTDVLSLAGQKIGRYKLERVLGEGAMSAVYVARQANPERLVALKVFRTALPMIDARQRFRREAQALARLRHPNIAAIYEAGLHDTGDGRAIPFLAIEYVDGRTITDFADTRHLDRQQRIELLIKVALAVQAAHQQALIHCDLKPPNVLVDNFGEPRVLDFGIARIATIDPEHAATWQTTGGLLLGTPGYMSPEQCTAEGSAGIDVRADVWALGVMLYELVLGRLPIQTGSASITDILRKMEAGQITPPRAIDPLIAGDLETIISTALRKEKDKRYASAQALADDLRNFLGQRPIEARPPTRAYLFKKFARRNRGTLALASLIVLLIITTTVLSSIGFIRASRAKDEALAAKKEATDQRDRAVVAERTATTQRDAAVAAEKRTKGVSDFLTEIIGAPDPVTGRRDVTVLDMLRQNERRIESRFAGDPVTAAALHDTIGWTFFQLSEYDAAADHMRKAIALYEQTAGRTDPTTIDAKCRLVTILRWQYKPADAKTLCDAALADAESALGHEHPSTYALLDNEAGIANDVGDFPTAIARYRDVYAMGILVLGPDDEQTLIAADNLSYDLIATGAYAEAATITRDVVARYDRRFGPDTPHAFVPRNNLATALLNLGHYDEAASIASKLVDSTTRVLGPEHDNTLIARTRAADIARQMGDYDAAIATMRDVISIRTRTRGPLHPDTLSARNSLLTVLADAGHAAEAQAEAQTLIAELEQAKLTDPSPLWTARALSAAVLGDLKRYAEASALSDRVYQHDLETFGMDHPDTVQAGMDLALNLADAGRTDEAIRLAREELGAAQRAGAIPLIPNGHRVLGRVLTRAKQFDESERELAAAWEWYATITNPTRKLRVIDAFMTLYTTSGDATKLALWRGRHDEVIVTAATRPTTTPTPGKSDATTLPATTRSS